jgi:CRISPR-associated endonuclease/helicase Cas3
MSLLKFDKLDIKREDIKLAYRGHRRCIKSEIIDDKKICLEYENESLKNHIDLVYDYFLLLVKENGLESHLDTLFEESVILLDEVSNREEFANFVKNLFAKAVYWHDMGKMNPNFQADKEKMNNSEFKKIELSEGSNHSPLGAYLFINHSLQELYSKNWDEDEIEIIESIIYLFGYFISKHHGSIYQSSEFDFKTDVEQFLELFKIEKSFMQIHKDKNRIFSSIYDYIEENKDILFLLSKSLFSLLIISDYYATAQFMNYGNKKELEYKDFGLIDEEFSENIYEEFYIDKFDENKKQKTFNQALKEIKSIDIDFKELEEKSNKNLNILRNKLFLETRETLRKNITKNLFYIEAPTGAGKTNLSVMSAVEILKEDKSINKIFYVFPFTTLITQTYDAIKNVLNLNNSEIVQLHSKAKYNDKQEIAKDGVYGDEKTNFLDNQFMNYPITLFSHVKFFNVLTGVSKDDNYIFHRLANSIVIIDEIQTYSPNLWSSMVYLLDSFAKKFNIKFIVMSATLPKIGDIIDSEFTFLVSNKQSYFSNPNFGKRVEIFIEKKKYKEPKSIYGRVLAESKAYQKMVKNKKVKTIIEFITKKGADEFYQEAVEKNKSFFNEIFILSGTILEPRRREIIDFLKNEKDKNVLLVTTQVVEAGVDIDMDIGFKERSLVDSDEQLAGRINRNSSKEGNKLFLFEMENPKAKLVYKGDKRLGVEERDVLTTKDFDEYYNQVLKKLKIINNSDFIENLNSYKDHIKNLRFSEAHIKIIDMESVSVFVPWNTMAQLYWNAYKALVQNKELDFTSKKIRIKKLSSKLSKYTFPLAKYQGSGIERLAVYSKEEYGYLVLDREFLAYDGGFENGSIIYTYKNGLDTSVLKGENVGMFI